MTMSQEAGRNPAFTKNRLTQLIGGERRKFDPEFERGADHRSSGHNQDIKRPAPLDLGEEVCLELDRALRRTWTVHSALYHIWAAWDNGISLYYRYLNRDFASIFFVIAGLHSFHPE